MDLLQTILNAQGGQAVDQLGQHVGLDRDQTVSALQQLLPALAGGIAHNASQPGGLDSLLGALSGGGHQQYLNNPASLAGATDDGNGILGHVLGSKDVSRQVADAAAAQTGIGADVLKKMLPLVASLAMGALSQHASSSSFNPNTAQLGGGGLLDMLAPMLGGGAGGGTSAAGGLMGMLGQVFRR
jgi:hypothetical protein